MVTGALSGVLESLSREDQERGGTQATFNGYARAPSPFLNTLGYLEEGLYRHSHDSVMKAGESGLIDYCGRNKRDERT